MSLSTREMIASRVPLGTIFLNESDAVTPTTKRLSYQFGRESTSGVKVNEDVPLSIDTIFSCINVLAQSVACLPLDLYISDGKKIEKATDEAIYDLIRWQPNPEMTAYNFKLWLMVDALYRGRGCAQIQRDSKGKPLALWPLLSKRLRAERAPNDGRLIYVYAKETDNKKPDKREATKATKKTPALKAGEVMLEANEVLIIHSFFYGGIMGNSVLGLQNDAVGNAKAVNDFSSEYFRNAGVISGFVKVGKTLSETAYQRLKRDWNKRAATNARHEVPILEDGSEFVVVTPDAEETQLIESRKYTRSIIAGIFRVPAHLINDLEKATFSNVEHLDLSFVKHTLRPWLTNWEESLSLALLDAKQRKKLYFKFNTRDLLRGDLKSRIEAYGIGIEKGIFNADEVRGWEDLNPYQGGNKYYRNAALVDVNAPTPAQAPQTPSNSPQNNPNPSQN